MPEGTQGSETGQGQETAQQPAPNPQPKQSAAPTVPDGMELVPKDELETLRRQSNSYRGQQPLVQPLLEAGIKSREDLDSVLNPYRQARELNIDLGGVLQSLRRPEPEQSEKRDAPFTRDDLLAVLNERDAAKAHEQAEQRETELFRGALSEVAGEKATDAEKRVVRGMILDAVSERSSVYESGPFKGKVRPLGEAEFRQIKDDVAKVWRSVRGQQLQDVAANAGTARAAPPAPGGAGAADNAGTNGTPRPGTPEHRALVRERLERMQAARAGAPLSQA